MKPSQGKRKGSDGGIIGRNKYSSLPKWPHFTKKPVGHLRGGIRG